MSESLSSSHVAESVLTDGDPFQGVAGRECTEVVFLSLLLQLLQGYKLLPLAGGTVENRNLNLLLHGRASA